MSKRNTQRAARRIQAECGANYSRAFNWVRDHHKEILAMIIVDDKVVWAEYAGAAAGLWRKTDGR